MQRHLLAHSVPTGVSEVCFFTEMRVFGGNHENHELGCSLLPMAAHPPAHSSVGVLSARL